MILLLLITSFSLINSFKQFNPINRNILNMIDKNNDCIDIENNTEKTNDIFDKFEKYSREKNIEMQDLYLFKIQLFLNVKSDFDSYKKYLLEDDLENQKKLLKRIKKYVNIQLDSLE